MPIYRCPFVVVYFVLDLLLQIKLKFTGIYVIQMDLQVISGIIVARGQNVLRCLINNAVFQLDYEMLRNKIIIHIFPTGTYWSIINMSFVQVCITPSLL